jgi:hypothetical protein
MHLSPLKTPPNPPLFLRSSDIFPQFPLANPISSGILCDSFELMLSLVFSKMTQLQHSLDRRHSHQVAMPIVRMSSFAGITTTVTVCVKYMNAPKPPTP